MAATTNSTAVQIERKVLTRLPTDAGDFRLALYHNSLDDKEHLALVIGEPRGRSDVLVRVHSECFTGDVLGSQRCDCGEQLRRSMHLMAHEGQGILLYLRQEGRGIGLGNKIRAYALQERGADTIQANHALGFDTDLRRYDIAACMLKDLGLSRVQLMTNNPDKIRQLEAHSITVSGRLPHVMAPNEHNRFYLETKAARSGHFIDLDPSARLPEQDDPVIVANDREDDEDG